LDLSLRFLYIAYHNPYSMIGIDSKIISIIYSLQQKPKF
jgi:hypothetical protein